MRYVLQWPLTNRQLAVRSFWFTAAASLFFLTGSHIDDPGMGMLLSAAFLIAAVFEGSTKGSVDVSSCVVWFVSLLALLLGFEASWSAAHATVGLSSLLGVIIIPAIMLVERSHRRQLILPLSIICCQALAIALTVAVVTRAANR